MRLERFRSDCAVFVAPDFLAALAVAPVFWVGLYAFTHPVVNLSWPFQSPLRFALLAVFYPVLEEIIFRGWLQEELHKWALGSRIFARLSLANLLTSTVFSIAHVLYHSARWAAATFFPSLVFGYFKDKSRRLFPSIVLHVFYNAGYFWFFGASLYPRLGR